MRAEQLGVAADALLHVGQRAQVLLGVERRALVEPELELDQRGERLVEIADGEQRCAIARDLGAARPRLQRHDRGLDDPAHEERGRAVSGSAARSRRGCGRSGRGRARGAIAATSSVSSSFSASSRLTIRCGASSVPSTLHLDRRRRRREHDRHAHAQRGAGGLRRLEHARVLLVGDLDRGAEQLGARDVAPQPGRGLERHRHRARDASACGGTCARR